MGHFIQLPIVFCPFTIGFTWEMWSYTNASFKRWFGNSQAFLAYFDLQSFRIDCWIGGWNEILTESPLPDDIHSSKRKHRWDTTGFGPKLSIFASINWALLLLILINYLNFESFLGSQHIRLKQSHRSRHSQLFGFQKFWHGSHQPLLSNIEVH